MSRRALLAGAAAGVAGLAATRARAGVPGLARDLFDGAPADVAWSLPAHDLAATRHARGAAPRAITRRARGAAPQLSTPYAEGAAPQLSTRHAGPDTPRLNLRWRARFPGGVPASAAIDGGLVFAASGRGAVAALRLRDGHELWRRELGTSAYGSGEGTRRLGFFSGVALTRQAILVAGEAVHCLDRRTGRTLWSAPPLRTRTSDDYCWGAPTVVGDLVLVGSGSGGEVPTARGRLTAYSLADGKVLWSTPTVPEGANGGGVIAPASVDPTAGLAYVATGSPYRAVDGSNPGTCSLIAMSLEDGRIVWRDQVFPGDRKGFDFNSAPVIVDRLLVATNKDGIFAWDRRTGRRAWHRRVTDPLAGEAAAARPTGGPEGGPIATDGQRIYVLSNDLETEGCVAAALAPRDGRVIWRTALPAASFGAPALAGGRLHVPGADGTLRVLDAARGRIVAGAALGAPSSAAPAIAAGHLVVGTGAAPYLPGDSLVCLG